jgi:hypothetical protein
MGQVVMTCLCGLSIWVPSAANSTMARPYSTFHEAWCLTGPAEELVPTPAYNNLPEAVCNEAGVLPAQQAKLFSRKGHVTSPSAWHHEGYGYDGKCYEGGAHVCEFSSPPRESRTFVQ